MNKENTLLYSRSHLWVRVNKGLAVIGVTYYYLDRLATINMIELKAPETRLARGDVLGTLESTKAAVDLETPVSGKITAVNDSLITSPDPVNKDPLDQGWLVEIELEKPAETRDLMTSDQYQQFTLE